MSGTFLHIAHEEGLIRNTSIHAGIRAPLLRSKGDKANDVRCGFDLLTARDLDRLGVQGVIEILKNRVADTNVYVSVDIDVLDPAFAPGKLNLCIPLVLSKDPQCLAMHELFPTRLFYCNAFFLDLGL